MLSRRVLSKEEEADTPDAEVTKEDQDRINTFSRLHQRSKTLEEELEAKRQEKDDLSEISLELELADEDELIPYKVGDTFFNVKLSVAHKMLAEATEEVEKEVSGMEEERDGVREQMDGLKGHLYARFGRGINLEA